MMDSMVTLAILILVAFVPALAQNEGKPCEWNALIEQKSAGREQQRALRERQAVDAAMQFAHGLVRAENEVEKEKLIDALKEHIPVDDSFDSALLARKLKDSGAAGKKIFDDMTTVQQEIDAVTNPGKGEHAVVSLMRNIPLVGRFVSKRINRGENTEQAIDRIDGGLKTMRTETRTTKNELRATIKEWERLTDVFEAKAADLGHMKKALVAKLADLPERSPERHALEDVIEVLGEREYMCLTNAENLLKALKRGEQVKLLLNQGERMLDVVINTDMVQLRIDTSLTNAMGSADKVNKAVEAIRRLRDNTNKELADTIARVTDANIQIEANAVAPRGKQETDRILHGAHGRQEKFETERKRLRDARIEVLKKETVTERQQLEAQKEKNKQIEANLVQITDRSGETQP